MQHITKHTDILSPERLDALLAMQATPTITIYLPTHRAGVDTEQGPIHLKNLLAEAETQLAATEMRRPTIEAMLAPAARLLTNEERMFWQHQTEGLAIFLAPDFAEMYQLTISPEPQMVIGEQFYIKPLIPYFSQMPDFYVLTLDLGGVKLWHGTNQSLEEVAFPEDTALTYEDAIAMYEFNNDLQMHSSSSSRGGGTIYHGAGSEKENTPAYQLQFFQSIDTAVRGVMNNGDSPLIVVGTSNLQGMYRQANEYPHLLAEGLDQNPTSFDKESLFAASWTLVEPHFDTSRQAAWTLYQTWTGQRDKRAIDQVATIVSAAYFQRIDVLFVAPNATQWGHFDPTTDTVTLADTPTDTPAPLTEDLVDVAIRHTLINGGQVYYLPDDTRSMMAALLRY